MKTKVNRTIETIETVETEVEFPKYTRNDFSYRKHYSEDHCVMVNVIGDTFASVLVTHNNKGRNLFDKEISESEFNRVMERVSAMLMQELQVKLEEQI
jgi:hypothetical protein